MKNGALYENGMTREEYLNQAIRQYDTFDYSDPMTTTDEELFGKWEKNRWAVEPLLDYDRVKGLEMVARAARAGDYPECKRLILSYYNRKFDTFHFDAPRRPDEKTFLCLEMQMENFFVRPKYGPWPLDKMLVGKEPAWHETDILPAVQPLGAAADRQLTLHLYALKKDGYTAKFHSRKNEKNCPFAEVTVNGEKRKYPAVMDAYLCGGSKRLENFGGEKLLLAEESYSSIHKEETADEYSRRAVLKFDFSDLGPEDKISEAVLHLYGWMEKSDNPVASGIEKERKIVFLLNDPTGNLWDEKELVWQNLDNGGWVCFSYDGTPGYVNQSMLSYFPNLLQYRSSIMAFGHELEFFADCAAVEKDDAAVFHILRLMMHKTRQLHCDFTSTEQPTLNLFRVRCIPALVQKCRFSQFMTPEIFTTILKSVYEHCEAICGADRFHMHRSKIWTQDLKKGNIGAIQTASLFLAAIIFDEFKAAYAPLGEEWEEESFNGGWFQVVRHRYEMCMKYSFLPDGTVTDIPFNYIWTNLWNYIEPLAEWSKKFHFDMRKVFTDEMIERIIRVCEYAARIISPLSGGWQIGDSLNHKRKQLNYLQDIVNLFPDRVSPHLKYIASEGREGRPDEETAMVSDDTSRVVIRSNWSRDAVALHFQSNSHLYHTHNDDLSVVLMAYGNYLLADPIRYLYVKTDAISNWQISRAAHSSVWIDREEPQKAGGSLHPEDRAFTRVYDFLHGDSGGYGDALQERYICFVRPGYFIISDYTQRQDENEHTYLQSWHFQPDAGIAQDKNGCTGTCYQERANLIVAPAAFPGELAHRIETGYYSQEAQQTALATYQYAVYEKRAAGNVGFQTLLYPMRPGKKATVETAALACSASSARAMHARIREEGSKEITLDYYIRMQEAGEDCFGRYETDGAMALVEQEEGKIVTLILRKGSFIRNRETGKILLQADRMIKELGISLKNSDVILECSDVDAMITYDKEA